MPIRNKITKDLLNENLKRWIMMVFIAKEEVRKLTSCKKTEKKLISNTYEYTKMKKIPLVMIMVFLTHSIMATSISIPVVADTVLSEENVKYELTQDENYVVLRMRTSDHRTMMSMLNLGVSVFFDSKGKKKENVYLKYPSEPLRPNFRRDRKGEKTPEIVEVNDGKRRMLIKEILENDYPQNAEYGYFDYQEKFHILLNTLDISVSFVYNDGDDSLEYVLKIPKNKINANTKKGLSKLTVGIKTTNVKRKKGDGKGIKGNVSGLGFGNGRSNQGRSGGRQGGRSSAGRGQGKRGGGPPANSDESGKSKGVVLDFWFKPNF